MRTALAALIGALITAGGCSDPASPANPDTTDTTDTADTIAPDTIDTIDPSDATLAEADAPSEDSDAPVDTTPLVPWQPGTPAFVGRTEAWGLVAAGALGVRLSAVDVDGDGWVDLVTQWQAGDTKLLRNTGNGTFEDITARSGLTTPRTAGVTRPVGVFAFADVDNDGDVDAYHGVDNATQPNAETSELYLNDGSAHFTLADEADPIRMAGRPQAPASASFSDVDRDGHLDLWVPMASYDPGTGLKLLQSRLFRGDGDGHFSDVTVDAGLTTKAWNSITDINQARAHPRAWAATACDLNDDGAPELLVASYGRSPNHLWQADGGPELRYRNRSLASGYAYDDDFTWSDNAYARCYCEANRAAAECAAVPAPVVPCLKDNWSHGQDREPFRLGGNSATTLCADLDNDGDLDLFTSEIRHWWAGSGSDAGELLWNTGLPDVTFERPGRDATGLAIDRSEELPESGVNFDLTGWNEGRMTATLVDFDRDGWPDLYVGDSDYPGSHGRLYRQDRPGHFAEVAPADAIDHPRSHGVVAADFDHDGDVDLVVGHNSLSRCRADAPDDCLASAQLRLFENVAAVAHWVALDLEGNGVDTNRGAIGARVVVTTDGLTQTQEISAGHGLTGTQNDRVLSFGLAGASTLTVTVRWPDAARTRETFTLAADHRYRLRQGGVPERVF